MNTDKAEILGQPATTSTDTVPSMNEDKTNHIQNDGEDDVTADDTGDDTANDDEAGPEDDVWTAL